MKVTDYVKTLILIPGIFILYYYAITGKLLNITLTYLLTDGFVLFGIIRHEQRKRIHRRIEEEMELSGKALEDTLYKLEKLRKAK